MPRSVAIVGASSNPDRLTGRPLRILRMHDFPGPISIVHPRLSEIDGVPAYPSVEDLPTVPDVVVIMVRADSVIAIARACGEKGVCHLVVLSSGFEETDEGTGLSVQLKDIAAQYDMGIVGPNSEGLWYLPGRTLLTFGSAAMRDDLVSGPVAVLSQSGSIGASIMRRLNASQIGADVFVSVGNETVLGVADYLSWIVANTEVRVVLCFLEGLGDGRAFLDAASAARAAGVAVVALKAGSSDQGRAASASHTGKISTAATVYDALFAQAGVLQVGTVEELADAAALLTGPPVERCHEGAGLTVIGLSGGSRSIIADASDRRGVPLALLAEQTSTELATFIPSFGVTSNPVDPTGQVLSDPTLFPRTIEALAADPNTAALHVQYANGGTGVLRQHLPSLREAVRRHRIPVMVGCLLDQLPVNDPVRQELARDRIGYSSDPTRAVEALALLFEHARARAVIPLPASVQRTDDTTIGDWAEVAAFARSVGLRAPRECVVSAAADGATVATAMDTQGLTFPVVVKPSPDDIAHKSDLGLVYLDIRSADDVTKAIADIRGTLGKTTRVVIQEFVKSDLELLVVVEYDPDFGPIMGIGLGGYFVELLGEISYVALPATPEHILAAFERTRVGAMLRGYRSGRAVDSTAMAKRLSDLGRAYAGLRTPPRMLELNPVSIVGDDQLCALDALVEPFGARS